MSGNFRIEDWLEDRFPAQIGLAAMLRKELTAHRRAMRVWWRVALLLGIILLYSAELLYIMNTSPVQIDASGHSSLLEGMIRVNMGPVYPPNTQAFIGLLLLTLVLPFTTAAFAREREVGTLDLLLLTRLRNREILLGKLLPPLLPILGTILPALYVLCLGLASMGEYLLRAILPAYDLLLLILNAGLIGLCASLRFHNTSRALGAAIVAIILLVYRLPFALFVYILDTRGPSGVLGGDIIVHLEVPQIWMLSAIAAAWSGEAIFTFIRRITRFDLPAIARGTLYIMLWIGALAGLIYASLHIEGLTYLAHSDAIWITWWACIVYLQPLLLLITLYAYSHTLLRRLRAG